MFEQLLIPIGIYLLLPKWKVRKSGENYTITRGKRFITFSFIPFVPDGINVYDNNGIAVFTIGGNQPLNTAYAFIINPSTIDQPGLNLGTGILFDKTTGKIIRKASSGELI